MPPSAQQLENLHSVPPESHSRATPVYNDCEVAVVIPCLNEEQTIGKVIDDFRRELPTAHIYVFDNNCTDRTASIAKEHGAIVIREPRQGKGYVVERIFEEIQADYYVMVDGDDTYPADKVHQLLEPLLESGADMVIGTRLAEFDKASFRPLHHGGNLLVKNLINWTFSAQLADILSGYRAFSRRVVAQIPVISAGFEIETEMTIQMLHHRLTLKEVDIPYGVRPEGSVSKLHTIRDGIRVLNMLFRLLRAYRPLEFFGTVGILFFLAGLLAGIAPIRDYILHQYVYHVPLAILATGLVILSGVNFVLGILLSTLNTRFRELHSVMARERTRSHRPPSP